jgi:DNA gyrase subunit A
MATRRGTVKKTELTAFANIRANGIIAVDLRLDDELIGVALTRGEDHILLFSDAGRVIRFKEGDVRSMGRGATGVRGMRLVRGASLEEEGAEDVPADETDDAPEADMPARVIAMLVAEGDGDVLTVSSQGYGKRTPIAQFPLRGRGGQGVIAQALNAKTGDLVGALPVNDAHEIMLITESGNLIRTRASEVRVAGRNTQGVRIMRPDAGDRLVGLDRIETEAEDDVAAGDGAAAG